MNFFSSKKCRLTSQAVFKARHIPLVHSQNTFHTCFPNLIFFLLLITEFTQCIHLYSSLKTAALKADTWNWEGLCWECAAAGFHFRTNFSTSSLAHKFLPICQNRSLSSQDSRSRFEGFQMLLCPKSRCTVITVRGHSGVQWSSDPRRWEEELKTSQDPPANLVKATRECRKYIMALKHDNP